MDQSNASSAQAGPGPSSAANAKRRSTVTTTIVKDDGSDSARIGACSNCRSRKIKCSGDKPICKMCAKYSQECEYPIHVSRKRKDRESGPHKPEAGSQGKPKETRKRRMSSMEAGPFKAEDLGVNPLHFEHSMPVNNFFPTLDFTADSVPIQNPSTFDGTLIDDSWLENFLTYDFGSETPMPLQGNGMAPPNSVAHAMHPQNQNRRPSTDPPAIGRSGSASHSDKKAAKFRVPYFR